jgi:predicted amidohydrolase/ribosomal protein S18 acetylase RimI-like enzyme
MTRGNPTAFVRRMTRDDISAIVDLQSRVFAGMNPWKAETLARHLTIFPEGQLVAVDESGRVLGSASSLVIDWDDYAESAKWSVITGAGTFDTHNPLGKTLYGADISVEPLARRRGIGSLLYEARKQIVRELALKRLLAGGRIPGYAQVSQQMTPKEYVADVIAGKREDPTLSFQLKNGFVVLDIIPDYVHDNESRNYATLLEWLNPQYVAAVSLHASDQQAELKEVGEETLQKALRDDRRPRRVRVAAMQYLLRPINSFDEFATQVQFFVNSAADYRCHFVLFPEFFTMQLLSYLAELSPARAVRRLAQLTPDYEKLFKRLATENRLYIIAGTHPVIQEGQLFNAAHLFTPTGQVFRQKKVHLTPTEKNLYQISRGHGFYVYHTEYGRIAILVCYDVEFPEAARVLAEAGAEILFVPSCTDNRQGFCRVRYCAQARAIENQIYVVMAGTVGNQPQVPHVTTNYSQAAIMTPSDYFFARDGIAAEGNINQEQMVISDVDLDLLREQRANGTVVPLKDLIKDAYDRVIHYTDQRDDARSQSKPDSDALLHN